MAVSGSGFATWICVASAVACDADAGVESVLVRDVWYEWLREMDWSCH